MMSGRFSIALRPLLWALRLFGWQSAPISLALILMLPCTSARAVQDCSFHDWLVTTYFRAQGFERSLRNAPSQRLASLLERDLQRFSPVELRLRMRSEGLGSGEQIVSRFFLAQRSLISARHREREVLRDMSSRPLMRDRTNDMREFLANMRCVDDPSWSPNRGNGFGAQSGNHGGNGSERWDDSLPPSLLALYLISGASVAGAVSWIVTKYRKRLRRRSRRFTCSIPCKLHVDSEEIKAEIVDISRLGIKIRVRMPAEAPKSCRITGPRFDRDCKVIWGNAHFLGLAFETVLHPSDLKRLLRSR